LPPDASSIDYFELFFTQDLIEEIVVQTNLYAQQFIESHQAHLQAHPKSPVHQWIKQGSTTSAEMKAFFGVIYNMGLIRKPSLKSYWDTCHSSQATPWFKEQFTRDRFMLLLRFLHFADNSHLPSMELPENRTYKIQLLLGHCNRKFRELYSPEKDVAIDESMVGFRGRTPSLRQYLPNKRHARFGIKCQYVNESSSGYSIGLEVDCGRTPPEQRVSMPNGPIHALVMRLLRKARLLNEGHHLTVDNYYSSPTLFKELFEAMTTATGTVRGNRKGLPHAAIKQSIRNKEVIERRKGPLLCVAYQDGRKKPVLLSTEAKAGFGEVENRRGQIVRKPNVVLKYNKTLGGIDLSDGLLYHYLIERKTIKWTNKVAMSLFGRMMLNAYILYVKSDTLSQNKMSRHEFIAQVVESMVAGHVRGSVIRHRRSNMQIQRDQEQLQPSVPRRRVQSPWDILGNHALAKLPGGKKRNCVQAHDKRVRSSYMCNECDIGLCPECFAAYHKKPRH
jgi:hypothetical protein